MPAVPGLRSPYETVGGLIGFGRTLDKIKLFAAGRLPEDYHRLLGDGNPQTLDARGCSFLRIKYADLVERVKQGGTDEEILAWAYEQGRKPSEEEIVIFNAFLQKRGWRDQTSDYLAQLAAKNGIPPGMVQTFPDMMDFDEERPPRFPPDPELAKTDFKGSVSIPGLRSPYEMVGGLVHFGRMIDKMRLSAQGKLPPEWEKFRGPENAAAFDGACCRFLGVDYAALEQEVLKGGADEAVLAWAMAQGRTPAGEEVEIFNNYILKRGWRDSYTERLHFRLNEVGLPPNAARTGVDFIDLDEGRPLRFSS